MRIIESAVRSGPDQATLVCKFAEDGSDQLREIQISVPAKYESFLDDSLENFLPALLLPAMYRGEDLTIEGPVDPQLLRQSVQLQQILTTWYDDLTIVQIHTESGTHEPPPLSSLLPQPIESANGTRPPRSNPFKSIIIATSTY